ncbi:MAG: hypothetical protein LBN26_01780 [Christensenellaceae bacterium]|nr:hypothetical protein [Christensenellaceae bacterium]
MNKHQGSKKRGWRSFLSLLLVVLMMVSTLSDLGIAFAEAGDEGTPVNTSEDTGTPPPSEGAGEGAGEGEGEGGGFMALSAISPFDPGQLDLEILLEEVSYIGEDLTVRVTINAVAVGTVTEEDTYDGLTAELVFTGYPSLVSPTITLPASMAAGNGFTQEYIITVPAGDIAGVRAIPDLLQVSYEGAVIKWAKLRSSQTAPLTLAISPTTATPEDDGVSIEVKTGAANGIEFDMVVVGHGGESVIVAIPVPTAAFAHCDPVIHGSEIAGATLEYVPAYSFTYNGEAIVGPCMVYTLPNPEHEDPLFGTFALNYYFDNGVTPNDSTISITGYILDAQPVLDEGNAIIGWEQKPEANGGNTAAATSSYTLFGQTDEVWSVEKTAAPGSEFTTAAAREYTVVAGEIDGGAHETLTQTYTIKVNTSGDNENVNTGREYVQSMHIHDVLSGYKAGAGVPTSIVVKQGGVALPIDDPDNPNDNNLVIAPINATSTGIDFDVTINPNTPTNDLTFTVEVTYDKLAYTTPWTPGIVPLETMLTHITNTAQAAVIKVITPLVSTYTNTGSAPAAIGYYQDNPHQPKLTVNKLIEISGPPQKYTSALDIIYGDLMHGAGGTIQFILQPTDTNGVSTGAPQTEDLAFYSVPAPAGSKVEFANLAPGTYKLTETGYITSNYAGMPAKQIVVSDPDVNGSSTVQVGNWGPNAAPANALSPVIGDPVIEAVNTSIGLGDVSIQLMRQHQWVADAITYGPYNDVGLTVTLTKDGTAETHTITNINPTGDGWFNFKSLPSGLYNVSILVGADPVPNTLTALPLEKLGPALDPTNDAAEIAEIALGQVRVSTSADNRYVKNYNRNTGSFLLGKQFLKPDGTADNVGSFYVEFEVSGKTDPLFTPQTIRVPYAGTATDSATAEVVQYAFPAGEYYIKETALYITNGTNAARYTPLGAATNVQVTVQASLYGAAPININGASNIDETSSKIINRSVYGELAIHGYNYAGANLGGSYRIERLTSDGSAVDTAFTALGDVWTNGATTVTVPAGGVLKKLLPAGKYRVTALPGTGYTVVASAGTDVTVAEGTASADASTADGTLHTVALNASVQTAAFMQAVMPTLTTIKRPAADTTKTISGGTYALYKKNGGNWELVVDGTTPKTTTAAAITGVIQFANMPIGEYAVVEVVTPAGGYTLPPYSAAFIANDTLATNTVPFYNETVSVASATGVPTAEVTADDYAATGTPTPTVQFGDGSLLNVRPLTISIRTQKSADSAAVIGPWVYKIYEGATLKGTATATDATPTGATYITFKDETDPAVDLVLQPGHTYTITQTSANPLYLKRGETPFAMIQLNAAGAIVGLTGETTAGKDIFNWEDAELRYSQDGYTIDTAGNKNELQITAANHLKPSLTFQKLGETNTMEPYPTPESTSTRRKRDPLPGALFQLYYEVGSVRHYAMWDEDGRMLGTFTTDEVTFAEDGDGIILTDGAPTAGGSPAALSTLITANNNGNLLLNSIIPPDAIGGIGSKYKLSEVWAPHVIGSEDEEYTFIKTRDIMFDIGANGYADSIWIGSYQVGTNPNDNANPYELVNELDPYFVNLNKWLVHNSSSGLILSGYINDVNEAPHTISREPGGAGYSPVNNDPNYVIDPKNAEDPFQIKFEIWKLKDTGVGAGLTDQDKINTAVENALFSFGSLDNHTAASDAHALYANQPHLVSTAAALNGYEHKDKQGRLVDHWDVNWLGTVAKKMDDLTTGGGADGDPGAYSRQLPAGRYILVESSVWGLASMDAGFATHAPATNAYADGNPLYNPNDFKAEMSTGWNATGVAPSKQVLYFELNDENDDIWPDDETGSKFLRMDVGNYDNGASGGIIGWAARVHASKYGYEIQPNGDTITKGPLTGVAFGVYYGYVNGEGKYQTLGGEQETVTSRSIAYAEVEGGRRINHLGDFVTEYYSFPAYNGVNGGTGAGVVPWEWWNIASDDGTGAAAWEDGAGFTGLKYLENNDGAGMIAHINEAYDGGSIDRVIDFNAQDVIDGVKAAFPTDLAAASDEDCMRAAMSFHLVLIEKGPLPPSYVATNSVIAAMNPPSYCINVLGNFEANAVTGLIAQVQTTNIDHRGVNSLLGPLRNYTGEGKLNVEKFPTGGPSATLNQLTGIQFELYKAPWKKTGPTTGNYDPDETTWELVKGIRHDNSEGSLEAKTDYVVAGDNDNDPEANGDGSTYRDLNTYTQLLPGYYFLKEIPGQSDLDEYNDFGTYTAKVFDGTPANPATGTTFINGLIGPIILPSDGATIIDVDVYDVPMAKLYVRSWWGNAYSADTTLTATYQLKLKDPVLDTFVAYPASGSPITVTASNSGVFDHLVDGDYELTETTISGAATATYRTNTAVITFTVANGIVVLSPQIKVDGASIYTSAPAATNDAVFIANHDVFRDGNTPAWPITVNHPVRGALTIKKGFIDELGVKHSAAATAPNNATSPNLTEAKFAIEKYDDIGDTWAPIAGSPFTWATADWTNGITQLLDAGLYRVTETSVTNNANYSKDTTPVYVTIGNSRVVYLANATAARGTEANPLKVGDVLSGSDAANVDRKFYNNDVRGVLKIHKLLGSEDVPANRLSGAEFDIYSSETGGTEDFVVKANSSYWNAASDKLEHAITLSAGTYWVEETVPPTNYALRTGRFPITVLAATVPTNGTGGNNGVNTLVVQDAVLASFKVVATTTYPAIQDPDNPLNTIVPAEKGKVFGLPLYLYQKTGTSTWTLQQTVSTAIGTGLATFINLGEGTYAVVEGNPMPSTHAWLDVNTHFATAVSGEPILPATTLSSQPSNVVITAAYVDGALVFTPAGQDTLGTDTDSGWEIDHTIDLTMPGGDGTWKPADNLKTLTINHEFSGVRFAAHKQDFDTATTAVKDAVFALYESTDGKTALENAQAGNETPGVTTGFIETATTNTAGNAVFTPIKFASPGAYTYYIKEISAPGYVINEYFDTRLKPVVGGQTNGIGDTPLAIFRDKKLAPLADFNISKTATTLPATIPALRSSGFDATYTIAVAPPDEKGTDDLPLGTGNKLPLSNYQVVDGGFVFKGKNALNATITVPTPDPTYAITKVRVLPSAAFALATDNIKGFVWARVSSTNGLTGVDAVAWQGEWKQLDDTAEWTLPTTGLNPANQTITVDYNTTKPTTAELAEQYPQFQVGAEFVPGDIELDVTFDSFTPALDATQPEVDTIWNGAVVSGSYGGIVKTGSDDETVTVPVPERPTVTLTKAMTIPANGEVTNGGTAVFQLTLKNTSAAGGPNLVHPILIDYMEPNVMALDTTNVGAPDGYLVTGKLEDGNTRLPNMTDMSAAQLDDNVWMWSFPNDTLEPGETLIINVYIKLATFIDGLTTYNEAYATSGAALVPTIAYPTGASFKAGALDRDIIFNGTTNVGAQGDYDKLIGISAPLGLRGLFVRSEDSGIPVKVAGAPRVQKLIQIEHTHESPHTFSAWVNSTTPQEVHPGDIIHYQLRLLNALDTAAIPVFRFVDQLPNIGDGRSTEWNAALRSAMTPLTIGQANVSVSGLSTPPDVTVYSSTLTGAAAALSAAENGLSTAGISATANIVALEFKAAGTSSTYSLPGHTILTVDYAWELPAATNAAWAGLLTDNALKVANNTFWARFTYAGQPTSAESTRVAARLVAPPVAISGYAWEDNYTVDGTWDDSLPASEPGVVGVTATLYKRTVSTDPGAYVDATTTGTGGYYEFTNLESSYGSDVQYLVKFTNPAAATYNFTKANQGAEATDSDAETFSSGYADGSTAWFSADEDQTYVNAGLYEVSTLTGTAWRDTNDDGTKAGTETGTVANIKVTLKKGGVNYADANNIPNPYVYETYTDASGNYSFGRLPKGIDYTVVFDKSTIAASPTETYLWAKVLNATNPAAAANDSDAVFTGTDRVQATATSAAVTVPYGGNAKADPGIYPLSNFIEGYVWEDANLNGQQGLVSDTPSEPAITGVTVKLYRRDVADTTNDIGTLVASTTTSTTTGSDGIYRFTETNELSTVTGLDFSGIYGYRVVFTNPSHATSIAQQYAFTTANTGADATDSDAVKPADAVPSTTDGFGVVGKTAWATTSVNTSNIDCGFYKLGSIQGLAWLDAAPADGIRDNPSSEPRQADVDVTLYKADGTTQVGTSTTADVTGAYTFSRLEPNASYVVKFDKGDVSADSATHTYEWTTTGQGTDATNSDASYTNSTDAEARTGLIALGYGATDAHKTNWDAGIKKLPNYIAGVVWEDVNADGIQSSETTGIATTVKLYKYVDGTIQNSGNPIATISSETDGSYRFDSDKASTFAGGYTDGIEVGSGITYKVEFVNPNSNRYNFSKRPTTGTDGGTWTDVTNRTVTGAAQTAGDTGTFTLAAPGDAHVNAGLYRFVTINGKVWMDRNSDNGLMAGEDGVTGVVVTLYTSAGNRVNDYYTGAAAFTATTSADGLYEFRNVPFAGSPVYEVRFNKENVRSNIETYSWTELTGDSDATSFTTNAAGDNAKTTTFTPAYPVGPTYENTTTKNAGIKPVANYIAGAVWEDEDADGIQSSETTGIATTVKLYKYVNGTIENGGAPIATVTSTGGIYTIAKGSGAAFASGYTDIEVSSTGRTITYKVEFTNPDGTLYNFSKLSVAASNTTTDVTSTTKAADNVTQLSGSTDTFTVPATGGEAHVNAGLYKFVTIKGYVWRDVNHDGIQGGTGEVGITGVTVGLYTATGGTGGTLVQNYTTNANFTTTTVNGVYEFRDVPFAAGTAYEVRFNKAGLTSNIETYEWTLLHATEPLPAVPDPDKDSDAEFTLATATDSHTASVTPAYSTTTKLDAGIYPLPNYIAGVVWEDVNADGIQDVSETTGIAATVKLYMYVNGTIENGGAPIATIISSTTDGTYTIANGSGATFASGYTDIEVSSPGRTITYKVEFTNPNGNQYNFSKLPAGTNDTYTDVANRTVTGAAQTAGDTGTFTVTAPGDAHVNAGLYKFVTIKGKVWLDRNSDDGQMLGEDGQAGVVVTLYTSAGDRVNDYYTGAAAYTATTGADGLYEFRNVPFAGNPVYEVRFNKTNVRDNFETYSWTDPAGDSDATIFTPDETVDDAKTTTIAYTTAPYTTTTTKNAGIKPVANSIGNYVWLDVDNNGIQDAGETGISGVTVRLYSDVDLRVPAGGGTGLRASVGASPAVKLLGKRGPIQATPLAFDPAEGFLIATTETNGTGYFRFASGNASDPTNPTGTKYRLDSRANVHYWLVFENPEPEKYIYTEAKAAGSTAVNDSDVIEFIDAPGHPNDLWYSEGATEQFQLTGSHTDGMDCGFYELPEHTAIFDPRNDGQSWNVTGPGTGWVLNGGKWEIIVREGRHVPIPLPYPKRSGYRFNAWYYLKASNTLDASATDHAWNFDSERMPARDVYLDAKWERRRDDTDDPTPIIPIPGLPPKTGDAVTAPWATLIIAMAIAGWVSVSRRKKNQA